MKCTHTYTSSNLAFEKGFLDTSEVHEGSNSLASSQGKARVGKAVKRNYRGGHRILPLDRTTVHLLGQSLLWELCPCIIVPSKTRDSQWQPFPLTVRTRIPTVPHITDPLVYLIGRFTTVHLYPPQRPTQTANSQKVCGKEATHPHSTRGMCSVWHTLLLVQIIVFLLNTTRHASRHRAQRS